MLFSRATLITHNSLNGQEESVQTGQPCRTGAFIKGTGVESQGVIPFLKIANDVTVAINRSGRRRGAACVYLECWHYEIHGLCRAP